MTFTETCLGSVLILGSLFLPVGEAKAAQECNVFGECIELQSLPTCEFKKPSSWDYELTERGQTRYRNDLARWNSIQRSTGCVVR